MKYLKLFKNHTQYSNFTQTEDFILPNVSHCISEGDVHYNPTPDLYNGIQYVDMGFPSGTKWATMNVGANDPLEVGNYYTWGETTGYTNKEDLPTYDASMTYDEYNTTDHKYILESDDDVASINMGGKWRTPSREECTELALFSVIEYIFENKDTRAEADAIAIKFTSIYNGNSIVVPAADFWVAQNAAGTNTTTNETANEDTKDTKLRGVTFERPFTYFWTNERLRTDAEINQTRAMISIEAAYGAMLSTSLMGSPTAISSLDEEGNMETFIRHSVYIPVRGIVNLNNSEPIVCPTAFDFKKNDQKIGEGYMESAIMNDDNKGALSYFGGMDSYESDSITIECFANAEGAAGGTISLFRENGDVICSDVDIPSVSEYTQDISMIVQLGMGRMTININSTQTYLKGETLTGYIERDGIKTNLEIHLN